MSDRWIDVATFAELADVSMRRARAAIAQSKWRSNSLVVRRVPGRGGRSGLHYEVLLSSLPQAVQESYRQQECAPTSTTLRGDASADAERSWRFNVIEPALAHPRGSKARGAAVRAISTNTHLSRQGKPVRLSERTIHRWLSQFEQRGIGGLQRTARMDQGRRRVLISRLWDRTVPFETDVRLAIAQKTTEHVRGLWRSGAVLSMVLRMGSEGLMKATREAGFDPGDRALRRVCTLPRRFVEPHAHLRKIHRFERDRKAHEDAKPRIRRTRTALCPMELVVGDVHHLDIYLRHEDGRLATPKMIGWLDFGTMRLFASFVLCPISSATNRSESIRNEHVIASFISMTQHPEWGMPRSLYLDNGSEYNFADFIDDALKLVADDGLSRLSPIIRAKPYNAPAKAIEGVFGLLERNYFSQVPGWIGGDRTNAKTSNVGRLPVPFPGSIVELEGVLRAYLTLYETQPQSGDLQGRSPRDVFFESTTDGWHRIDVDPFALRVAFSTEETRTVRQGSINVGGRRWTCPELQSYLGDQITVLIPKYEDWLSLPLRDDHGRWLGNAVPDQAYHPLDPEGARETAKRSRRFETAVRTMGRTLPRRDLVGEAIASAALVPDLPVPRSEAVVKLRSDAAAIGRAIEETPKQRRARERAELERDHEIELERSERSLIAARRAADKRTG